MSEPIDLPPKSTYLCSILLPDVLSIIPIVWLALAFTVIPEAKCMEWSKSSVPV